MKKLILNYTFDASEKKVTFSDYTSIILDSVLMITNVTDNVVIYMFNIAGRGGTVATNVLTLDYSTTDMDDSDDLQIFYDDGESLATAALQSDLESLIETLQELIQRLAPLAGAIAMVGGAALRVQGVSMPSTAVTGPITSANSIAEKALGGVMFDMRMAQDNLTAVISNINNCTPS